MIFIVMGVSGSGKSTVGLLLARALNLPFYDADDFHPAANVEKMAGGIPLVDDDRQGWLEGLAESMISWERDGGAVLACSALKESYRVILQSIPPSQICWVFLEGSKELLMQRIAARTGHYMPPTLLESQLATLERPAYGIHLDIAAPPEVIVQQIINKLNNMSSQSAFGVIGMGVMGKSLALNLAGKNTPVSVYNRHVADLEVDIAKKVVQQHPSLPLKGFDDLSAFVQSLEKPRKILLMIVAGKVVDFQIAEILPLLDNGDVLIDGGNSHYTDTARRTKALAEKGINFVGTGISGGEEGALKGPSMMPGGPKEGYELVAKYLESIAARDKDGKPCTTYIGPEGAGHFVKMVHNGIEYAEMQLLAETYSLLRYHLAMKPADIARLFEEWQTSGLDSYLLEITIDILKKEEEDGGLLLDKILDKAAQKGTGGWSAITALEHGVPYSSLTEAVLARSVSSQKAKRVEASKLYNHQLGTAQEADKKDFILSLQHAYQATRIVNHDIGFNLMREVSDNYHWALNFSEISRIWTNGCIIRSQLMEALVTVFKSSDSILAAPQIIEQMKAHQPHFAKVVGSGLQHGFALPVISAALNYFLGSITANSPANMIQAQRDYFGAHTYKRIDKPADQSFHTIWKA